ncbi:MAG TPA: hypothetical protein VFV86_12945 [Nitrososphaeraceae archaeon]|nr:hypothetical protein [Nitrososphaeraceae archaeon]
MSTKFTIDSKITYQEFSEDNIPRGEILILTEVPSSYYRVKIGDIIWRDLNGPSCQFLNKGQWNVDCKGLKARRLLLGERIIIEGV